MRFAVCCVMFGACCLVRGSVSCWIVRDGHCLLFGMCCVL